MPPRRTHTKSRNGCAKCKKRRVKCDEVHPSCGNCIKHAIECDFSSVQAPDELDTPPPGSALAPKNSATTVSTSPFHSGTTSTFPPCNLEFSLALLPVVPQQQKLAFPLANPFRWTTEDMELIHHFIVAAPGFLAPGESGNVWRDAVPKLAFGDKYGYLIHAMLAVSSLHLSFLGHGNRSVRLINATAHYDQAVRLIGMMLSNICKDNCEALFISSGLIVIFATAMPLLSRHSDSENEQWSLPEWLPLVRGVNSIISETRDWVERGSLSPILHVQLNYQVPISDDMGKALNSLYQLCTDTLEPDPEEIKDTETSSTYFGAIHELHKSFSRCPGLESTPASLVFIWPIHLSDKYVALLKERRPRALIIFAHYCALLKYGAIHWWAKGRAEYELVRIERCLQERWHKWLEWPKKMVQSGIQV